MSLHLGLHQHDARKISELFPKDRHRKAKKVVTLTITSPPYHDMKDYGYSDQLGHGQGYEEYKRELIDVFRNIYDATKDNGSLWVIVDMHRKNGKIVNLPFNIAEELQEIGWILKDVIIWEKDKTLPWISNGRFRKLFEYVFFFTKSDEFKFKIDRIREPENLKEWWVKYPERYNPMGKAPTNVWHYPIPVQGSWGQKYLEHFCPFPIDMIAQIIQLCSDSKDIVLDPFAGSGSVVATAEVMGRRAIGVDLNKRYVSLYSSFSKHKIKEEATEIFLERKRRMRKQIAFYRAIERLRQLKYAKMIIKQSARINKLNFERLGLNVVLAISKKTGATAKGSNLELPCEYFFIFDKVIDKHSILEKINETARKPPLSKFGVKPHFSIISIKQFQDKLRGDNWYVYTNGRMYYYAKLMQKKDLQNYVEEYRPNQNGIIPIISNIGIRQKVKSTWRRKKEFSSNDLLD